MYGASEAVSALTGFHPLRDPHACSIPRDAPLIAPERSLCARRQCHCRRVRGNAVSRAAPRRCGGLLLIVVTGVSPPFKSLSPGLITPQSSLPSRVKLTPGHKTFCGQKLLRPTPDVCVSRWRWCPCGEGSQTGDVNTSEDTKSRFPQNINTAAPETQRVMRKEKRRDNNASGFSIWSCYGYSP